MFPTLQKQKTRRAQPMRLAVCAAVAALPCARPQIVRQLATESTEYRVDARSVAVFSVDATEAPVAPECPGTCPDEGYMVCSGTCPIDCYCADGWGMYVDAESLGSPTNLSMAMSDIALDRTTRDVATAYSKFSASSEWSILPFVTLFAHSEDVANSRKRKSSRMVYGLVDLCKFTAAAGGATPVGDRSLECNCDGCRDSCGIAGSRKLRQCAADGDYVATSESAHIDYSGCTYYASSDALSGVAQEASFCCNAVPSAFEEYIGAIPQHQHFHDWKSPPKTHFASLQESYCNTTTGESTGSYAFEQLAISRCLREILTPGTYYLYVVNTDDAPQDIRLSYSITTVSLDEASVCYGNRFDGTVVGEGGAARATHALAVAALLAAMWTI